MKTALIVATPRELRTKKSGGISGHDKRGWEICIVDTLLAMIARFMLNLSEESRQER